MKGKSMNLFMEKIKEYYLLNKVKIIMYFSIFLIFIIFSITSYFIYNSNNKKDIKAVSTAIEPIKEKEAEEIKSKYIYVDIKGFVKSPGVYEILEESRVIDAINVAGGLKENANTRFINLSKMLNDGDVIVIYSNEEIENAKKTETIYVETPCVCEEVENTACYNEDNLSNKTDNSNNEEISNNNLININTASSEELQTIKGIGDAKASAIIEYRNTNGLFNSIEDIKNVNGISESLYDKIKDFITTE